MPAQVVAYRLEDSSVVRFEIDPPAGFQPAGADKIVGQVQEAIKPAIDAAKVILGKVREAGPDEVEVTFGLKVSGRLDWIVARASSEANFQIKLGWRSVRPGPADDERSDEGEPC